MQTSGWNSDISSQPDLINIILSDNNLHLKNMGKKLLVILLCLSFMCIQCAQNKERKGGQPGVSSAQEIKINSDIYWFNPQKTFKERCALYLDYCISNPGGGRNEIFSQVAFLEKGFPLNDSILKQSIDYVYSGKDCNDFTVGGLLKILYRYKSSSLVTEDQRLKMEKCLLDFNYWWTENLTRNARCYWTENHEIIFHMDELLAGQLFRDKTFVDGKTGQEHMNHALNLITKWMEWRVKFGFSEWLSHAYFEEDLMSLLNLYNFAEDPVIKAKAGLLTDVLMYEMALNSFHGTFGSTHGRTYAFLIKGGRSEPSASTIKLIFGMGIFNSSAAMGAVSLATSNYKCPSIIQDIAADYSGTLWNRERQSINIDDAPKYGLSYDDELTCDLYWSIQDYTHPSVIDLSQKVTDKYGVWTRADYDQYRLLYQKQTEQYGKIIDTKLDPHALTEVNLETCRTPDYMLSCAQDYRPGSSGYQQHTWQATLGIDAVVFTNHPGSNDELSRPNYWAGNGIMPRAAQYKNVVVCIYKIPPENPLPFLRGEQKTDRNIAADSIVPSDKLINFTHAYFPKDAFDEVIEKGNWIFGRKENGYIALYSQNPYQWKADRGRECDLIASGTGNIWICEMGSKVNWRDFSGFISAITSSNVKCDGLNVNYISPSQGDIKFGWTEPLQVKGKNILLKDYLRFDNPYTKNTFASDKIVIKNKSKKLVLDFRNAVRDNSK
jgi:hypothetical protein